MAYAERHNIKYSAIEHHTISISVLEEAAREQGLSFRQGDILLVRSGVTKWYNESNDEERKAWLTYPQKASVGVDASREAVEWVWNHHFAAVAGDALAWEAVPYPSNSPCKFANNFLF